MTDKSIVICAQILFLYDDKQAEIPYSSNHFLKSGFLIVNWIGNHRYPCLLNKHRYSANLACKRMEIWTQSYN